MEKNHLEIILEDMAGKFQLVLEGHASLYEKMETMERRLTERIDQVEFSVKVVNDKVDTLDRKVDAVAADLTAHRADTEAHHGVYRVKEPGV